MQCSSVNYANKVNIQYKTVKWLNFLHLDLFILFLNFPANDLGQIDKNIQALEFEIPLVSMVAAMCDKLGDCVLNDPKQSLNFVKLTLERCSLKSNEMKNEEKIGDDEFQNETLSMALGILSLVITNMKGVCCSVF